MISRTRLLAVLSAAVCLAIALQAAPALAATPAWQPVAVSGPTNLPPTQSEVQKMWVDAEGGTFTLTQATAAGSGKLSFGSAFFFDSYPAGATELSFFFPAAEAGFEVGQTIGAGAGFQAETEIVNVAGNTITLSKPTASAGGFEFITAASKVVSGVSTTLGSFQVGGAISAPGIPPGTTIAAVGPGTLTLSADPTQGGVRTLTSTATTDPIDFDADAAGLEAKLNALSGLDVAVSGGPGGKGGNNPYLVSFGGDFADTDVPTMSADASALIGSGQSIAVATVVPGGPGTGTIAIYAQNVGGEASSGTITVEATLPAGLATSATPSGEGGWSCSPGAGQQSFTCTSTKPVQPGGAALPVNAPVAVGAGAASGGAVETTVSGAGASPKSFSLPLTISSTPPEPGIQTFTAGAYDEDGELDFRAGGHPYSASTAIFANTLRNVFGNIIPVGEPKDIVVDLPPGFLGNPVSTPQCPEINLVKAGSGEYCPPETMVGRAAPVLAAFGSGGTNVPVYNIDAPLGYPGKFYFNVLGVPIHAVGSVRSDEDYGLTVGSYNTAQIATVYGSFFTFWGSPADSSHDDLRCDSFDGGCNKPSPVPETAFLSSPTDCAREAVEPPVTRLQLTLWQSPLITHVGDVNVPAVNECENLKFDADFTFEPSDTRSDSPASFRTELAIPSEGLTDPEKLMTPTINESIVELPKGVVLNASAADGLGACSKQQIGLKGTNFPLPNRIRFTKDPQTCPDASKIGSGELKSELLADPLQGALYLAAQGDGNPFGSLFAIYLVIEDPRHGIFIKLPGEVRVDESDGQQRIVFRDLPQLPFTYLRLNLKGGSRSPLASPTTCGTYITNAINTPWSAPESGPPTVSANGFEINQGPNGQPCANTPQERPFDLALNAGTDSTKAGAHTPLTFQITRPDGSQELNTLDLGTAPGLVASLKGIPQCGASNAEVEAKTGQQEQASSSCPAASQIGRTLTGAGSGPSPFYSSGKLYLAGPYKGAPLSVIAITPAVAGPFDLGNVVVRTALFVNRQSAQVTAKTDPIPQILEGVPLRIKDVRVILDRDNFSLNPTSCAASAITVHATGNSGAAKDLSSRFQVGGCKDLAFKPKLSAKLTGGTKRGDHPAFTAELNYPPGPGYANIKDVQVTLPHSEFLDQAHINTICTRIQAAANACPPGAIYGFAEATTPLLDGKLTGPVFLKSSDHQLPDLAISLKGPDSQPVEVEFQGRIDSIKAQIRNTIEGLPDVPVTKFVLKMKGGRKGLLVNSRNLCKGKVTRMTVKMVGQNNRQSESRPPLTRKCKGKAGKAKPAAKGQKRGG